MPEEQNGFYRDQYFKKLDETLERIEKRQEDQAKDMSDIKSKLSYMVGWAVGAGAVASLIFEYVKAKLTSHT